MQVIKILHDQFESALTGDKYKRERGGGVVSAFIRLVPYSCICPLIEASSSVAAFMAHPLICTPVLRSYSTANAELCPCVYTDSYTHHLPGVGLVCGHIGR